MRVTEKTEEELTAANLGREKEKQRLRKLGKRWLEGTSVGE